MSLPDSVVTCSRCEYSQVIEPIPIILRYQLTDGEHAELWAREGWCQSCASITAIETLPSLQELVSEVDGSDDIGDEIAQSLARVVWRARRRGPATCLECGSVYVEPIVFENVDRVKDPESECPLRVAKGFRHDCGGMLMIRTGDDIARSSYFPRRYLMNIEGQVLEREVAWDEPC